MDKITEVSVAPLQEKSRFLKPMRMQYKQNGVQKFWDTGISHPSVCVLIYNKTRNCLVLVKQLRPACLLATVTEQCPDKDFSKINEILEGIDINETAITLECCAGIVDKSKTLAEIARDEVFEECGYDSPLEKVEFVQTFRAGIGTGGSWMSLFYVEVTDSIKTGPGGGLAEEGEMIEVVEMSPAEIRAYMMKPKVNSPPWTLYAFMWFFSHKYKE